MILAVVNNTVIKAFLQGVCCGISLYMGKTPLNTSKRKKR